MSVIKSKNIIAMICLLSMLHTLSLSAFASLLFELSGSYHLTGYGARGKGMGSAFTAIADDATAASFNPAGLVQLRRPEFSLVYRLDRRYEYADFIDIQASNTKHPLHDNDLDYFSVTLPFRLYDMDMGVTLAYQHLYDFNRHWLVNMGQQQSLFQYIYDIDYQQSGQLSALGFSFCLGITPRLSLGITLNWWDDDLTKNSWRQSYRFNTTILLNDMLYDNERYLYEDQYAISGFNANIGMLWEFTPGWRMGAMLKTPLHADLTHTHIQQEFDNLINPIGQANVDHSENNTFSIPMSFGLGLSCQVSDNLLITADLYHTLWDHLWIKKAHQAKISPITGNELKESDIDDTTQIRLGMEYLWVNREKGLAIPFRLGAYYDPVPWEKKAQDYFGLTVGSGIELLSYQQLSLDVAYEYRWGDKSPIFNQNITPIHETLRSHQVYMSLIVYLK